ncbi:hypothetical protein, unknown function [Leishmania tarentolae]|uniref:Uncharacterized protein n=1 Tax=Leishmania tarentolae TaxID=5689 RepID=A0A640KL25_LEITA|nr:hypothetical protein, unknown function [Leishmania tarentolae]
MGQSAPKPSPRTQRSERLTPQQRRQQLQQQNRQKPLQAVEQVRCRQPTLKEQWQAQREANAVAREAKAMERKQKKEALQAALKAQQKQAEDEQEYTHDAGDGSHFSGGGSDDDNGCSQNAEEAELVQARIRAQLEALQTFLENTPDVEEDLGSAVVSSASMFDREDTTTARLKDKKRGGGSGGNGRFGDGDDDEAIANVSVHSSDYADEELMRGLDEIDEELEQEFLNHIDVLQQQVSERQQQSLIYLREHNDKAAALRELQTARQIKAHIKQLLDEHAAPLRVQIDEQQAKVVELENLVAARKQESIATLRGGDKPTALTLLKEAKGFESQLEEAKEKLLALKKEKEKQLRSKGED